MTGQPFFHHLLMFINVQTCCLILCRNLENGSPCSSKSRSSFCPNGQTRLNTQMWKNWLVIGHRIALSVTLLKYLIWQSLLKQRWRQRWLIWLKRRIKADPCIVKMDRHQIERIDSVVSSLNLDVNQGGNTWTETANLKLHKIIFRTLRKKVKRKALIKHLKIGKRNVVVLLDLSLVQRNLQYNVHSLIVLLLPLFMMIRMTMVLTLSLQSQAVKQAMNQKTLSLEWRVQLWSIPW